jgi:putative peptidoglycan lipid II flippase
MDRERQEPPVPPQKPNRLRDSQNLGGWSYDQKPSGAAPRPPTAPLIPSQQVPSVPKQRFPSPPNVPARYQEPIADMGTTLGYGQGMEYQYFGVPQPSQPMPQLRMERLQQLRQERLRREVRHARPDVTTTIRRRKGSPSTPLSPSQPVPPSISSKLAVPPSKLISKPLKPSASVVQPAAEPAQDTAMLKKQRIGRASAILMMAFIASRVLGLLRTSMFAATFGTGNISDAFVQASLLPDMIFNIVAGGALASAFIPNFTKYMVGENDAKTAWRIADVALTLSITFMIGLALIGAIFADPLVWLMNPGYRTGPHGPETLQLIAVLVRIMFIQAIILGGGVIVTSVLNANHNFQLPAIGTVLYNVGNILGLAPGLFLAIIGHPNPTFAVYCASFGVVLGAALNIGIQVPGLRKVGMNYRPNFDWHTPGILQIGRQMVPRIFNASVASFTNILDRFLIGLLGGVALAAGLSIEGLTTQYYQASQLVMLPLGIFGMAMSTAAFPTLTEYVSKGRMDRARNIILETLRSILFLSIPASIGLIVLAEPIIQVLLVHGRFTSRDAQSTAVPLAFYAVGLAGMAAVEILTRSFYAMRDSRTPVIISVLQFGWKIALGFVVLNPFAILGGPAWGMGALTLSTSLANLAEAIVLFIVLDQRIGQLLNSGIHTFILRVLGAAASMGVGVLLARILLDALTSPMHPEGLIRFFISLIKLSIELLLGTFIYLRAARFFKLEELGPVRRLLNRFKLSWML